MVPPMVLGGAAPPASACWGGRARGGVRGGACALALPAGGPCVRRRQARLGLQGKPVLGRARSGVTWGRDRRGASSLAVRDAAGEGGGEVAFPDSGGAQVASFFKPPARENFKGKKQGVVVLSDVYGFRTENVRSTADFLADKGYHVLVPDMFQMRPWPPGKPMEEGFETWKARYAGPPERALAVVAGAGEFLRKGGCTEVAVLGFGFGGGQAVQAMSTDAAVSFEGHCQPFTLNLNLTPG
mmetsp:Transcript_24215/g.76185  ORF Transcript_24215/g.76185 Transcript_24215/m.76185 type:complete len:241 (+) Transcript_24215:967-1689(+)